MQKILYKGILVLLLLVPLCTMAQRPRFYWRFEHPVTPWADHSLTAPLEDLFNPPNAHPIWINGLLPFGPVGSFLTQNPNLSSQVTLNANPANPTNYPTTWNPDGCTMELLVRMRCPTYDMPLLSFQDRMFLRFNKGEINASIFRDNCVVNLEQSSITVPLRGSGRLDENYYLDEEWHHYALRYNYDEATGTGFFNVFVDGLTLPEFTLPIDFRPRFENLNNNNGLNAGPLSYLLNQEVDLDEFAVWDEALSDEMIYQHFLDFQNGVRYAETTTLTSIPALATLPSQSTNMVRNEDDYVPGYDPNNPPLSVQPGTSTLLEQLSSEWALPRYRTNHSMTRNHQYIGQIGGLASAKPAGNIQSRVVDNVSEMYDHFNYSFYIGALQTAHNDIQSGNSIMLDLINEASSRNAEVTLVNQWGAAATVDIGSDEVSMVQYDEIFGIPIGNGSGPATFPAAPGGFQLPANTPALDVEDHFYFRNDIADGNGNLDYFAYNPFGDVCLNDDPSAFGSSLRPNADPWIGEMDGRAMAQVLREVEAQGVEVGMIIENGELTPSRMNANTYERITGTGAQTWTNDCRDGTLVNNIGDAKLLNATTAANVWSWASTGKHNLRTAMRNFLLDGNCPGGCPNGPQQTGLPSSGNPTDPHPDFLYYQVHENGPWDFAETHEINLQQTPNVAGQRHLPTPDLYPARAYAWNNGIAGSGTRGLNEMIMERIEELPQVAGPAGDEVRYGYFPFYIPAVSPGIDEGGPNQYPFDASETAMMRPGYYLGLLKATAMLGAENMITFQTNNSSPQVGRPHDASWWGWQFASPAYTQATFSREEDLFKNSLIMNGNMGDFRKSGTLGFVGGLRFWAGREEYVVMARKEVDNIAQATCQSFDCNNAPLNFGMADRYLISGTIQQSKPNTEYDANQMDGPLIEKNVKVEIDGNDLQFEIRKQGSTYVLDNNNPADPIFYQLDGWHESSHPSRWSKCFVMEAEVFDESQLAGNSIWRRITRNPQNQAVTDGNFVNFTTYMQLTGNPTAANPLTLTYRFHPRYFQGQESQINMVPYARVRARRKAVIDMEMSVPGTGVIFTSSNSVPATDHWTWIRLDLNGTPNNLPLFSDQDYDLTLSAYHNWLMIDKIVLCPAEMDQEAFIAKEPATGSWNFAAGPYCPGEELQVNLSLDGCAPWTFQYEWTPTGSTTPTVVIIEDITDPNYSFVLPLNETGTYRPVTPVSLFDANGVGTFTGNDIIVTFSATNPPVITKSNDLCAQTPGATLSISPTFLNPIWNTGETTSTITVTGPGLYQVSGERGGCRLFSDFEEVTMPWATITSNTGDFAICPGGGNITLTASTPACPTATFSWFRDGVQFGGNTASQATIGPGFYEVFEDGGTMCCGAYGSVQVHEHVLDITMVGSVCAEDGLISLRPSQGNGTWTTPGHPNVMTGFLFDTRQVQNPNNDPMVPVTLIYNHDFCGACPANQTPITQIVYVYFNCDDCLAKSGENMLTNGSFRPLDCPVIEFTTTLTPDCPPTGTGVLTNDEYTVTTDPANFGLPTIPDRTGFPTSGMFLGRYDVPVWKVVFSKTMAVEAVKSYAFSTWFNNLLTTGGYSVEFRADGNPIGSSVVSGQLDWEQIGVIYPASTTGNVLFEIRVLPQIGTTFGNPFAFAMDDICFARAANGLWVFAPTVVCENGFAGIQILGAQDGASYTIDGDVADADNGFTIYRTNLTLGTHVFPVVATNTTTGCNVSTTAIVEAVSCPCKSCPDPNGPGGLSQADMAQFKIFPNPSQGMFTLRGELSRATSLHVEVYNLMGVSVLTRDAEASEGLFEDQIDLTRLPQGTYMLSVDNGQDRNVFRLVKQ